MGLTPLFSACKISKRNLVLNSLSKPWGKGSVFSPLRWLQSQRSITLPKLRGWSDSGRTPGGCQLQGRGAGGQEPSPRHPRRTTATGTRQSRANPQRTVVAPNPPARARELPLRLGHLLTRSCSFPLRCESPVLQQELCPVTQGVKAGFFLHYKGKKWIKSSIKKVQSFFSTYEWEINSVISVPFEWTAQNRECIC